MGLRPEQVARAQGLFNVVAGVWPLVHVRSFEAVFGSKTDRWLEYTVAGLLTVIGWSQWQAAAHPDGAVQARVVGIGTAATLLAVDLIYVPSRRIPATYLFDAAAELGWLALWAYARERSNRDSDCGSTY
jgi:hypothetical protein